MANTGMQAWITLEQYFVNTGVATGVTKANDIGDPDYVAPVENLGACPIGCDTLDIAQYTVETVGPLTGICDQQYRVVRNPCAVGTAVQVEVDFTSDAGGFSTKIFLFGASDEFTDAQYVSMTPACSETGSLIISVNAV